MLKLGVWKPEQFFASAPRAWPAYVYYRLSRSRVSLNLLEKSAHASSSELFERLMPHVQLSNGVFRTTFRQRFRTLDPVVNRVLTDSFASTEALAVEDWAASACLTSAEWAETLLPLFPRLRFVASDLLLYLIAFKDVQSGVIYVAEPDGKLLQCIRPPFVVRIEPPEPWLMPLNRLQYLRARAEWQKTRDLWPLPEVWLNNSRWEEPLEWGGYLIRKLPLIHPEALALARRRRGEARFSIRRQSIFERAAEPVHVIRSMNILNKNYFPEAQLMQGIRAVVDSLRDGGVWVLGRTTREDPPVHDTTLFRKQSSGRLEIVEQTGAGSEICSLVLAAGG